METKNVFNTFVPQSPVKKIGQVSDDKIQQYFKEGFLLIEDFFDKEDLKKCLEGVEEQVEEVAQKLHSSGKIKDLHEECGVFERLSALEKDWPGANILLIKKGVMHKAIRDLWSNEKLLNLAEQIIGPEISGHPIWNLRCKVPQNEATVVPWHQDAGYTDPKADDKMVLTAWIPLLDTNEQNGCMQMVRGGHQTGRIATHTGCWKDTWYIELSEDAMEKELGVNMSTDVVTCPVPFGGLLLFSNAIPHRSLPNTSSQIRWSLDLRWHKTGEPNGFYGIKDSIPLRTAKDPAFEIEWDGWNAIERSSLEKKATRTGQEAGDNQKDEFDTLITGPWMNGRWKITNENRHTKAMKSES